MKFEINLFMITLLPDQRNGYYISKLLHEKIISTDLFYKHFWYLLYIYIGFIVLTTSFVSSFFEKLHFTSVFKDQEQSRRNRLIVILHRGFGGQNLGVKFGKFKKADLHHGLSGFWGDLLALDGFIGRLNTAFIKENSTTAHMIKIFFESIFVKRETLKYIRIITLHVPSACF